MSAFVHTPGGAMALSCLGSSHALRVVHRALIVAALGMYFILTPRGPPRRTRTDADEVCVRFPARQDLPEYTCFVATDHRYQLTPPAPAFSKLGRPRPTAIRADGAFLDGRHIVGPIQSEWQPNQVAVAIPMQTSESEGFPCNGEITEGEVALVPTGGIWLIQATGRIQLLQAVVS
jgi:hypothetical protein